MDHIAIKAENLSKRYRIGLKEEMHDTLFGAMTSWVKTPISNFKRLQKLSKFDENSDSEDIIWALKDVSFEVKQGEVVGIIGSNGAGKTTLLKILSQITEPTGGMAEINGRVASLLEVGTGFHPELTGRENIYLNGTILGMTKQEVDRKFDEIVSFSEIEKFLDTPIKRYSSGMHVRLAFSVAAHLEPEILLVDEVLAVGDASFQKKCLGKMEDISQEGRTVLFVSHNMGAVNQLCEWCIWLDGGRIREKLPTDQAIHKYLSDSSRDRPEVTFTPDSTKKGQFLVIRIIDKKSQVSDTFDCDESLSIELIYCLYKKISGNYFTFHLRNEQGISVLFSDSRDVVANFSDDLDVGIHKFKITMPERLLAPGRYFLTVGSADCGGVIDSQQNVCAWTMQEVKAIRSNRPGCLGVLLPWNLEITTEEN